MITKKMDGRQTGLARVHQEFQHFAARRATIHIVAKIIDLAITGRLLPGILDDPVMKPKQEIQSAVDVANHIEPTSRRSFRQPNGFLLPQ